MQDHRKLRVWTEACALAVDIRRTTRQFPKTGYVSVQSQMVRAAESVVFNIAEGCGSRTQKELARFLDICIKSTSEVEAQLELCNRYGVLNDREWVRLAGDVVRLRRQLCVLRAKVLGLSGPTATA